MEAAINVFVAQFKSYAAKDGSSHTLSKEEFQTLVTSQLPNLVKVRPSVYYSHIWFEFEGWRILCVRRTESQYCSTPETERSEGSGAHWDTKEHSLLNSHSPLCVTRFSSHLHKGRDRVLAKNSSCLRKCLCFYLIRRRTPVILLWSTIWWAPWMRTMTESWHFRNSGSWLANWQAHMVASASSFKCKPFEISSLTHMQAIRVK